jgi:dual specificity protein kinase YAK1
MGFCLMTFLPYYMYKDVLPSCCNSSFCMITYYMYNDVLPSRCNSSFCMIPIELLMFWSWLTLCTMQFVARLTAGIIQTYQQCDPKFKYSDENIPKRFLTSPSIPAHNDGLDNANWDLILYVNLELVNKMSNRRFIVKEMLGQGTFGQVVKCWDTETNDYVAVKVIKNQPAFYHQAIMEVSLLRTLNQKFDPDDKHNIVRMLDYLSFQNHLCIAFEMLGQNL